MRSRLIMLLLSLACPVGSLIAEDRQVFENNCAACHAVDGSGRTPQGRKLKAPDLRASRLSDVDIELRIREGAKNKGGVMTMPAFGGSLTAGEIQTALRIVKALRSPEPAGR